MHETCLIIIYDLGMRPGLELAKKYFSYFQYFSCFSPRFPIVFLYEGKQLSEKRRKLIYYFRFHLCVIYVLNLINALSLSVRNKNPMVQIVIEVFDFPCTLNLKVCN